MRVQVMPANIATVHSVLVSGCRVHIFTVPIIATDTPLLLQDESGKRSIHTMRWGLVPSYTKMEAKPGMNRYQYALTESLCLF